MEWINDLLGLEVTRLNTSQMAARAVIVFFTALIYMRLAGLRTLGPFSVFDRLTILITGAMLARAIMIGDEPFFSVLAAAGVVIIMHKLIAFVTLKSSRMGAIFKGSALLLVEDGTPNKKNMNKGNITDNDLEEAIRLQINSNDIKQVKEAWLERSGQISIVKKAE
jgi:uncharacterized membrane protein YcaP (DUF421 family)